ncbi:Rubisco LSMT, substrate-binding domain [Phytophthora cactorum]|nr:Rubisco LSMT, substrate-binding domain [Phytophthora cactorum]
MEVALKRVAEVVRRTRGCVVSSAAEARSIPGMGVGIVAREHIPKDTLVFQAGQDVWYPFSAEYALETAQQKAPGFLSHALVLGVHILVNFPHAEDLDALLMAMASTDKPSLDELLKSYRAVRRRVVRCSTVREPGGVLLGHFHLDVARYVGQNQPFALIPFFDWFNHADNGPRFFQKFKLLQAATGNQADMPALRSLRFHHDGQLAPNAEHWLEIMIATPDELNEIFTKAASQSGGRANSATSLTLPLSLKHKVRCEVGNLVATRLKQHSSTFEEDDAFLRANDQQMAPWLRSCLYIRMGEKQTLMCAASKYA